MVMWVAAKIMGMLGGPYNKDSSVLGSILGSPDFEKLPCVLSIARVPDAPPSYRTSGKGGFMHG